MIKLQYQMMIIENNIDDSTPIYDFSMIRQQIKQVVS